MTGLDAGGGETIVEGTPGLSASDVAVQVGIEPRQIGRFQVLRRLGRGGMGVVYSAYDEELDRRVAIKLLRHDRLRDPASMQQFRGEAQAMARLSHANVVQIYEVGDHEGQLYIAMEFVQGRDLRAWLHERHPWRERLAALCQAGRGLEAAHAAGIVHRDFKPDNVMIDAAGRVRVLDFGLAQTREDTADIAVSHSGFDLEVSRRSTRGIAGTPAYMAPEQHATGIAEPRSDQFSFCVVLYEAIYGERPFQAATAEQMARQIAEGRVKPPRPGSGVPRWLERAILRGLAVDPAERWPSMAALLAVAERDPARRRRQWLGASVVLGSLVVAATALLWDRQREAKRCEDPASLLAGVWDPARSAEVHAAMIATGVPYAEQASLTVRDTLDRYARGWSTMHTEVCATTQLRGEQSQELFDLRMGCLRRARTELSALVDVLAASERDAMENAARAPGQLPRLELCADAEALRRPRRPDPRLLAAAEGLRDELAGVKAWIRVGRYARAREALTPVLTRAEALAEPTLLSDVLFYHGDLAAKLGDYDAAERALLRSFTRAIVGEDDAAAARTAIESVFVQGYFRAELGEGERWAAIAEALLDRMGERGLLRARLINYQAMLREERGDKLGAAELNRASVALNVEVGAPPFTIAAGLNNLAVALGNSNQPDAAIAAYEKALAIYRETVGDAHPNMAITLDNLATVHAARGDMAVALAMHLDALQRREALGEAGHPNFAVTLTNLADLYLDSGAPDLALPYAERAVAITRAALDLQHPLARHSEALLARVYAQLGDLKQARTRILKVMANLPTAATERPGTAAFPTLVLAEIDLASGDAAAAAREFAEVLALRDITTGASHREVAVATFGLARARWELGQREGVDRLVATADDHFAVIHDEGKRREVAAWSREHPAP